MHPSHLLLIVLAAPFLRAQQTTAQPDTRTDIPRSNAPTLPAIPLQFNSNFKGHFTGFLEYRDYSAKSPDAPHTKLPTTADLRPSPDGRAINLDFTYDDGPDSQHPGQRKIVKEREILAFTADTAILTGTSAAQNQSFHVDGVAAFARTGYGTLTLTGPGKENDQPADFRISITLTPTTLTWRKESRPGALAPANPGTQPNTNRAATAANAAQPTNPADIQPTTDPNSATPTTLPAQAPASAPNAAPYTFRDQYTLTRQAVGNVPPTGF